MAATAFPARGESRNRKTGWQSRELFNAFSEERKTAEHPPTAVDERSRVRAYGLSAISAKIAHSHFWGDMLFTFQLLQVGIQDEGMDGMLVAADANKGGRIQYEEWLAWFLTRSENKLWIPGVGDKVH